MQRVNFDFVEIIEHCHGSHHTVEIGSGETSPLHRGTAQVLDTTSSAKLPHNNDGSFLRGRRVVSVDYFEICRGVQEISRTLNSPKLRSQHKSSLKKKETTGRMNRRDTTYNNSQNDTSSATKSLASRFDIPQVACSSSSTSSDRYATTTTFLPPQKPTRRKSSSNNADSSSMQPSKTLMEGGDRIPSCQNSNRKLLHYEGDTTADLLVHDSSLMMPLSVTPPRSSSFLMGPPRIPRRQGSFRRNGCVN